jgi:HEAT repeat protein
MVKANSPDNFNFDGVQLGPSTDYVRLVREQLRNGSVWPSGDSAPHQGVRRVIDAAEGTVAERRLLDALLKLLSDQDTAVRTGAVHLAWDYADKVNAELLLQALNDHPSLYEGVKPVDLPQSYMPDLAWGLISAMNASPRPDAQVIARLRRAAEDPINGFRVFGGLAAHDPDWLIDHASALVSHQPVRARIILGNLKTPKRREQFLRALANEPASFRKELLGVIADKVPNSNERDRLNAILA